MKGKVIGSLHRRDIYREYPCLLRLTQRSLNTQHRVVGRWAKLAERRGVIGSDVFDVQLVATMLENSVQRIYTYNRAAFEIFPEPQVLTPEAL